MAFFGELRKQNGDWREEEGLRKLRGKLVSLSYTAFLATEVFVCEFQSSSPDWESIGNHRNYIPIKIKMTGVLQATCWKCVC